jgi:ABC-2 type transport system ATP-binding protein
MNPSPLIEASGLSRCFGTRRAVDGISFTIGPGEIVGLLGANGAGKSTTLKMLTGFLCPSGGYARIDGHDVVTAPLAARAAFGYLPERGPLYEEMTVAEVLAFAARIRSRPSAAAQQALAACELESVRSQTIETLSKGFRQRVGLAQALLHDPPALLLDEPMDGLDPNQKDAMRRLLARMAPGRAILFSTHILEDVEALCTRVIVMNGGGIVADETPARMRSRHPAYGILELWFDDDTTDDCAGRARALRQIPGVAEVVALDRGVRLQMLPGGNREGAVLTFVVEQGWRLAQVERPVPRLEDVFRLLTRREPATETREKTP